MNPTVKEPKKRFMTLKRREACLGWLFVSPALIGFSIFTFGSILYSFYLSLTDYDLLSAPKWVGFDNYIRAFTKDQYFYKYFGNTLYFVVTLVPIVLALSQLGEQYLPRGAVPAQHYLNGCGQYGLAVDLQPGYGFDQQLPDGNRTE